MRLFLLLGPFAFAYAIVRGDWLALEVWVILFVPLIAYLTGVNAGIRQAAEIVDALTEEAAQPSEVHLHIVKQREAAKNQ